MSKLRIFFKTLSVGRRTSKITCEHEDSEASWKVIAQMRAVSVLLGGYNELGRKMPLERFEKLQDQFNEIVAEVEMYIR